MPKLPPLDPNHETKRAFLSRLGLTLLIAGVPTAVYGAWMFMSVFINGFDIANPNPGSKPVIGLILTALGGFASMIGLQLLAVGNLGRIARYQMAEALPPTLDAARHAAPVASEMAHRLAAAAGEGWRGADSAGRNHPHSCGAVNDPDAAFCKGCGKPLTARICAACRTPNDADARFCDACGHDLSPMTT